jgi:ssDNA-binding replication factor A large subunit
MHISHNWMEQTIQHFFTFVKDLHSETSFQQEIQTRKQEYDELFDEETIAYLLVDEMGRNTDAFIKIKDLHPGIECAVTGMITSIGDVKTFQRKKGSQGRLVKLILTDETGSTPLIFWNEDVSLIENNTYTINTRVTIINGYTKKGYHGIEINVGKWSKIECEDHKNNLPDISIKQTPEEDSIQGILSEIKPTNVFFRDDGTEGFITKICLKTSQGIKQLILWDKQVKNIQQFKIGDSICINHIDYRYINGLKEMHVNGKAQISCP